MSAFHNGQLGTMKAHYTVADGDLRVIRPLAYTRERATRDFAERAGLPIIVENCPACFEGPKERYRVKTLLASQEHLFPNLHANLLKTMQPLLSRTSTSEKGEARGPAATATGKAAPVSGPAAAVEEEDDLELGVGGECAGGVCPPRHPKQRQKDRASK